MSNKIGSNNKTFGNFLSENHYNTPPSKYINQSNLRGKKTTKT